MPQAPDPIGLPDLAPARTEANPAPCPPLQHATAAGHHQPTSPDDTPSAHAAGLTSARPNLRAFGPDHLDNDTHER